MLCCKKHLYYKLNWNYWLEMASLAQQPDLLGIHIIGIVSAAPTKLRPPDLALGLPCPACREGSREMSDEPGWL